jgi:Domain of unknown function (DUF1772)
MRKLSSGTGVPRLVRVRTKRLLTLAQLGRAHWFFGNLYEAVVRVPDHLAKPAGSAEADPELPELPTLFGKGSPVRYFVPGLPLTFGATIGALVTGWKTPANRGWLVASTVSTVAGGLATAYLVTRVNPKLFGPGQPSTEEERAALLQTWYRFNAFRVAAAGAGMATAAVYSART